MLYHCLAKRAKQVSISFSVSVAWRHTKTEMQENNDILHFDLFCCIIFRCSLVAWEKIQITKIPIGYFFSHTDLCWSWLLPSNLPVRLHLVIESIIMFVMRVWTNERPAKPIDVHAKNSTFSSLYSFANITCWY